MFYISLITWITTEDRGQPTSAKRTKASFAEPVIPKNSLVLVTGAIGKSQHHTSRYSYRIPY